jgi:hypothetical protein
MTYYHSKMVTLETRILEQKASNLIRKSHNGKNCAANSQKSHKDISNNDIEIIEIALKNNMKSFKALKKHDISYITLVTAQNLMKVDKETL